MEQFRLIWQYIRRHKWQYIGGIITLFILDFANLYIPKTTGVITDGLAAHTIDRNGVLYNIGIILGIGFTLAVGRFCGDIFYLARRARSSMSCATICFGIWRRWMWSTIMNIRRAT